MALTKSNINLNFSQGLDTKTDPWQITPGNMLVLENGLFTKNKLLSKRNGFGELPVIPDLLINTLTTFKTSLTAIGASLWAYVPEIKKWYNKGPITSVGLAVDPLVRSADSQIRQDSATTEGGLTCTAWEETSGACRYQVLDGVNSQIIVPAVTLQTTAARPKVSILGSYFIVTYLALVGGNPHLRYIAIPINNPTAPAPVADMSTTVFSVTAPYDLVVANNNLYAAYASSGSTIKLVFLTFTLGLSNTVIQSGYTATAISLCADVSGNTPTLWLAFSTSAPAIYAATYSFSLVNTLGPVLLTSPANPVPNLTGQATNNLLTLFYGQRQQTLPAPPTLDLVLRITCTSAGVASLPVIVVRGLGLASKAFTSSSKLYFLAEYNNAYQPTYFLIDSTSSKAIAKLAYQNGGLEPTQSLPSVSVYGAFAYVSYLYKDLTTAANKSQGVSVPGIYSQTGINLAEFNINSDFLTSAEIGNNLHLSGGYLSMYDGSSPVEHGFHLYPEGVQVGPSSPGNLSAQLYYYQVTYEWTDSQGNLHRSAPSIPTSVTVGAAGSVNLVIPTLRVTQKKGVRIVIYRWSTAQQNYYQITDIGNPLLNDILVDTVTYSDTKSDADILGNQLIYTTGGVIENIGAPACTAIALFKSRLFIINAEDNDVLWYSKQVIQTTPVETSDLFTLYVSPSQGAQANTGGAKALAALDDKLIIFKESAAYYVTGNGPDNTGANNDYTDPTIITATVGCANPRSIVLTPNGLMFQSNNGIWLLSRELSTMYIGAPVEAYNSIPVVSAVNVAGSNQVRFSLADGTMLMYDYFYGQWGTFSNVPAIAGTMFQGLHSYVDKFSQVFQETPGKYVDGSKPVLMKFTTGWFSLAGLQGLERAYFCYLLGKYISPHTLTVGVAINYDPGVVQTAVITPDNFSPNYGEADGPYGAESPYGGVSVVEQWRVFFETQKIESFQLTVAESYDSSYGVAPGAGFTMSGINLIVGIKKAYTTLRGSKSTG